MNNISDELKSLYNLESLSREDCSKIYNFCQFAKVIVGIMPELSFSAKRIFEIPSGEPEVAEELEKMESLLEIKEIVKNTIKMSRIFGYSTLYVAGRHAGKDIPPSEYMTAKQVREGEITFNILDPISTSMTQPEQDPKKIGFMQLREVFIQGEKMHIQRGAIIQHGLPLFLQFSSSAFTFASLSIFQNLSDLFILHKNLVLNIQRMAEIGGSLMVNQGDNMDALGSNYASGAKQQQNRIIDILSSIKRWGIAIFGKKTEVQYLGMQGVQDVVSSLIEIEKIIAKEISDTPTILFSDMNFSKGLSEGTQDMKFIQQSINSFREKGNKLYNIIDKYLRRKAWTPDFCEKMRRKYPDKYSNMTYVQMYELWTESYSFKFDETYPLDEKIKEEITAMRVNTYSTLKNMGATLDTLEINIEEDGLFKTPLVFEEVEEPVQSWGGFGGFGR